MTNYQPSLQQFIPTEKGANLTFSGFLSLDVSNILADFFISRGFVLGSGSRTTGTYEIGNAAGRALLGGFVNRQKYSVNIFNDANFVYAAVQSEMTGALGSVYGVVRERKGRNEFKSALEFFLRQFVHR